MRSFRDFDFKTFYSRTDYDSDIAEDFFIPCMQNARYYDRITGFFGSSVYIIIWGALKEFVENDGRMRILCSPRISKEDREAINEGLEYKGSETLTRILRCELERLMSDEHLRTPSRILACLIATGILEIRIVTTDYEDVPYVYRTMFHDKIGIFKDDYGNTVTFGGSMNETFQGLSSHGNSETISVNISWDEGRDGKRTRDYTALFEDIWSKKAPNVKVHDLPSEIESVFREYAKECQMSDLLDEIKSTVRGSSESNRWSVGPFKLREYQSSAVEAWLSNNRRGIFKHATGSGKTVSGMYCLKDSLERNEMPLLIVPSLDLQNQWYRNLKLTLPDVDILLCGGIGGSDWKSHLGSWSYAGDGRRMILAIVNTVCSDTFLSNLTQGRHLCLVADEVHRLGSAKFSKALTIKSGPRLGLSATPERFRDPEGPQAIFDYFGPIIHEFSLTDAVDAGNLTEYYYYPIQTHLTTDETEKWNEISRKLSLAIAYSDSDDPMRDDKVKQLLIMRSRIAKNAINKIPAALDVIHKHYKDGQKWLIYCDNVNQMNDLWEQLKGFGHTVMKYHSSMDGDRDSTLSYLSIHGGIVISIKCLDEGVDIPSVSHALILASSQNPREHIQRRGRVLRPSEGKLFSYIYDLVIVPDNTSHDDRFASLVESELSRAIKFGENAVNSESCVTDLRIIALDQGIDPDSAAMDGIEED